MEKTFTVEGLDTLKTFFNKVSNPEAFFDEDFQAVCRNSIRPLVISTQSKNPSIKGLATGGTSRGWSRQPEKIGLSKYQLQNNITTKDKKWNIARILDEGRGEITPKKAKRLFIPLSNKGVSRSKGIVWGEDFVLALKSKAVEPRNFIDPIMESAGNKLAELMGTRLGLEWSK